MVKKQAREIAKKMADEMAKEMANEMAKEIADKKIEEEKKKIVSNLLDLGSLNDEQIAKTAKVSLQFVEKVKKEI